MSNKRDFLSVTDITPAETMMLLDRAQSDKLRSRMSVEENNGKPLRGKSIAILFDKPSLRTRVSFQVGIEQLGGFSIFTLAYIGDGNNVARSLCLALPSVGMNFTSASPEGYNLDESLVREAQSRANNPSVQVRTVTDPVEAVGGADVVYTDVWASMGQESETDVRQSAFNGYTVDPDLMMQANANALFMHDMPAHYGEEVPPGMLDHPQSVAFPQAHNRLHAQKTILEFLLTGD